MSGTLFYVIPQGADWNEQLQFFNEDGSNPDLTGAEIDLQIFQSARNPIVLLDLSTSAGTITLNGPLAQINWIVPASQTRTFVPSPGLLSPVFGFDPLLAPFGFYNLRAKWVNGQIFRELTGQVALSIGSTTLL